MKKCGFYPAMAEKTKNCEEKMMNTAEKEYLYLGCYTAIDYRKVLKLGTTCDLERRRKEHTRNYRKATHCPMIEDGEFEYIWTIKLSKWNTRRFEESNIALWQELGIGEYIRNDRFVLCNLPDFVPVKIRKTYQIALA